MLVVGGGVAGYTAAVRGSGLGLRVVLVEEGVIGGTCLNVGCIPTKTLLESVRVIRSAVRGKEFGVGVSGIEISREAIAQRAGAVVNTLRSGVEDLLRRSKVQVIRGRARLLSPETVEISADGDTDVMRAGSILLATGSSWVILPGIEIDGQMTITSDHALKLEKTSGSLIIIGGGAIGCEMAEIYSALGTRVTIVEMMQQLLPGEDAELCRRLQVSLKRKGINVLTDTKVQGADITPHGLRVRIEGGEPLEGDRVLMAIGRRPNIEDLGLEEARIVTADGSIGTDESMRTSVPGIYAAGDVTGRYLLAHVAARQGTVAAENAAGMDSSADYNAVPRCIYTDPEYAAIGLSEAEAGLQGPEVSVHRVRLGQIGRALTMGETFGLAKIVFEKATGRILGFHALAPHASELVSEIGVAIRSGTRIQDLAEIIHPHPTLSEVIWECAQGAAYSQPSSS
jgi:dihydrolipoamide dehydrogenase